jgi:hypothetical protein
MKPDLRYPPASRGEIVVWGMLASAPYGGMTWQILHHLVGFRRLGFDVWYVEDSDRMLTDPVTYWPTMAYEPNVRHLATHMELVGLGDRWVFRPPGKEEHLGALDGAGLQQLYRRADVVFNLCGAQELRDRHDDIGCIVLLETDPVMKQVGAAKRRPRVLAELERYAHLFTYGTNLYGADCTVPPVEEFVWKLSRPPVITAWWATDDSASSGVLTTVTNWKHTDRDVEWEGARLRWSKHRQFGRFRDLPERAAAPLEVALRGASPEERERLRRWGWLVRSAEELADPRRYREYVRSSLGEFSFAKELVVDTRSGWVSDRTVCYLAAGRPAVVQDTGFASTVDCDGGLRAFGDREDALSAIEAIVGGYERERSAAVELAHSVFSADVVLREICETVGVL